MEHSATSKRPHGAYTDQLWSASRSPHCRSNDCPRPVPSPCYNMCAIAHGQVATSVCQSPTKPESGREEAQQCLVGWVCLSRYGIRHGQCTECVKITTAAHRFMVHTTDTYRHSGRPPQQPVNTISRIVRDRSTALISSDPHLVIIKPSFSCLEKHLDKSL